MIYDKPYHYLVAFFMNTNFFSKFFVSAFILCFPLSFQAKMTPTDLTCEMMNKPLAIETLQPRFGWKLLSDVQGDRQTAYQLFVSSFSEDQVWNSGKVKSDQSQFVAYNGKKLQPATRYYWRVKVWDAEGKETMSDPVFFETAPELSANTQWIGAITKAESHLPIGRRNFHSPSLKKEENKQIFEAIHPLALRSILLRKSFRISKPLEKAMVYISGLGQYNLSLNGEKVSRDIFTPAWSDYDKTVYYNTYALDSLLQEGENVIGILLGNGFYNAVGNRYRKLWISFGPPTLFLEMHLHYKDGTKEIIASDQSWKYNLSPITFNDIYGGEDYDARLEQAGWNRAGFNDNSWKPVVIQEKPQGKLQAQQLTNVRPMEQQGAISVSKVDSSYILNMGQNLSGYPYIKVMGKKGQTIQLTVGELLDKETGKVSQKQSGSPHIYSYTLKGEGVEEWHPEFSYYGFQYIQMDGANLDSSTDDSKPLIVEIKSHFIYNSVRETGHFECSNELFNRVHILIKNAVKSNMQTVFTDCPHREKLGWLEETHLNGPGLLYNWDLTQFFPKVMQDMANGQRDGGLVPSIVPEYVVFGDDFSDSPEWGSASIIVPWMYYRFYGDHSLIRKHYEVMKQYAGYLTSKSNKHIVSHGLGDWYDYGEHRAGYSKNSPIEVSATAHYYYAIHLLAEAAKMLGKTSDEKKYTALAKDIRTAFNTHFFNKETRQYGSRSQFCNAVALFMGIVEPQYKQAVLENLKVDIRQHGDRLTTGDVGNRYLFQALALNSENELMYRMNNHEDAPGYGFQLKFGVTTLTEQWDPRKGNSWNHFMMGQIDEWFFRSLAGIEPSSPGFKEFTVQPQVVGDLTYVKANHETLYGTIVVEWKRENKRFHLSVTVPVNTTATVILPNGDSQRVNSGKYEFEY
jgi:hypothetical protein